MLHSTLQFILTDDQQNGKVGAEVDPSGNDPELDEARVPWRTLTYNYTQDTTLHGMRYVTLATKYNLRR